MWLKSIGEQASAITFCFDVVTVHFNTDFGLNALLAYDVQLSLGAIPVSCKDEEFEQERPEPDVGWAVLDLAGKLLNCSL
jgi:hypothetical protein